MKNPLFKKLLTVTLLMFNLSAIAEDIDLFVGTPPSATDLPNVLIILDNTANWNAPFDDEMAALSSVVSALPENKFNVGLMLFNETGGGNSGNDGAYVRAAIRIMDSTNKVKYENLVNGLGKLADKGNAGKVGKAMEEAYLYYSGGVPHAGNNKVKTDYAGNTSGTATSNAVYALAGNALSAKAGSPYLKPVLSDCAKNYVIYISNGAAQDNSSDISQATAALLAAGGSTATIPISPSGSQDNVADEWARFMKKSDLNIKTYTVDINKVTTGQGPGFSALLNSMANASDGKYFDVGNGSEIANALNNIFSEIQSVSSVFASVSLPVSVNTQGTFLNQVYIGMFRPDADAFPRWNGNLKQYKIGFANNVLQLLDAGDKSAISSGGTGFIAECARSFWTPTTLDSYWRFSPENNCLAIAGSEDSNSPDGNIVEKGAQAFKLRSTITRNVQTCSSASCTSLDNFNSTTATQLSLGAASTAERDELINWQRGQDVDNEHGTDGVMPTLVGGAKTSTVMRPSAHGDVVHSRPVAINHGTPTNPNVVVYYGGNDGMLRAVNGNRDVNLDGTTTLIAGKGPGSELWSFVPPEFYSKIKRIRDNTVTINYPGNPTGTPKDYGVDGAVTAYKDPLSPTTFIYATMRRGGRAVYAFDVTTPATPTLKWKIGCPNASDDSGCTSGFTGLGQTWSSPKVLTASGYGSGSSPMLIMGGGYDTCHDADPNSSCNSSSKGNKVYILDANSGTLLKTFTTDSSVIADITVVADSSDAPVKYAYVADLGGNIYRISGATANAAIGITAPGDWTITKIAALGGTDVDNRKFMFTPDWIEDSGTYSLLLGSGDREKPLSTYLAAASVKNRFYMVKDRPIDVNWLSDESTNCAGVNVMCHASLVAITGSATPTATELAAKKGWYLALTSKEQVVTSAITVFNTVTFSTHEPTPPLPNTCGTLGTARVYNLNYTNAAPPVGFVRGETIAGGGLPPSPVAGLVTLDNGKTVPFCIGCDPKSPLEVKDPPLPPAAVRPKSRVYWNIKK